LIFWVFQRWTKRYKDVNSFKDNIWEPLPDDMPKEEREQKIDERILLSQPDQKTLGYKLEKAKKPQTHAHTEQAEKPPFAAPNFHGKAHQILGVPENAPKEIIMAAYRYWMKRYHPDHVNHLGGEYVEQARRRAEQLNRAKESLVQKKQSS